MVLVMAHGERAEWKSLRLREYNGRRRGNARVMQSRGRWSKVVTHRRERRAADLELAEMTRTIGAF